jgi:hypothetical protein
MVRPSKLLDAEIPRLHRVIRRLADGTTKPHFYHRPTKIRLPAPSEPDFQQAYQSAEKQFEAMQRTRATIASDSISGSDTLDSPVEDSCSVEVTEQGEDPNAIYLTPEDVCLRWRNKITTETLANWRSSKAGPPYSKFGKVVLYRQDLLEEWERKHLFVCEH